ncbi:MAG TPA: alcohol dehydrogenase catalytic domain-containing protein [Nitrososphaerales archaeon]|nr:alcohol dehydrogenase catalytic domain-containing protein [Nitrososphaerales archaeon]
MRSMRLMVEGQPLREVSTEVPHLGPRSVLVKVSAAGVCHSDLHLVSGAYDLGEGRTLSATGGGTLLPLTPGHEIAGILEELGTEADARGFRRGDQVIVYPWIGCGSCRKCLAGRENMCEGRPAFLGFMQDGGYADYVLVPDARYLIRSDGIEAAQAATLACSGLTAFSAIRRCSLHTDDFLLVIGAGGLGTAAIQIAAKTTGARVAVADLDDTRLGLATRLGAEHTFNTAKLDAKEIVSGVRALNGGRGADAVIDFVGKPATVSLGLRLLGHEGRLVLVGLMGGGLQLSLPILPLLGAQILGSFTGSLSDLAELAQLTRRGGVAPVVTAVYRLEEANEVLSKLEHGEIQGRAVLKP